MYDEDEDYRYYAALSLLLSVMLLFAIGYTVAGCASTPELVHIGATGQADVEIVTDQGRVLFGIGVLVEYEDESGDAYVCPTLHGEVSGALGSGMGEVGLAGSGLMPGTEGVVDARCLEDPGPFRFGPLPEQ